MKSILFVVLCFCLAGAMAQSGDNYTDEEKSALGSTRTLNTAQVTYAANFKDVGFACTLAQFAEGEPGKSTPEAAGYIAKDLASGHKRGYVFSVNCGGDKPYRRVTVSAVPENPSAGTRAFCSDLYLTEDGKYLGGVINYSTDGKAETCFIKGAPVVVPRAPREKVGY